jgi:hypothetical protein
MEFLSAVAIVVVVVLVLGLPLWRAYVGLRRAAFIRSAALPHGLFERLRKHHPRLTQKDCQLAANGLRQYFLAYQGSGFKYVAMPSQVVDDLWHEFILHTKAYRTFCERAFGRFFDHTPAAELSAARRSNEGLRRCWFQACRQENIDPRRPARLPLLFALDAKLGIVGGFVYIADCEAVRRMDPAGAGSTVHCGGDFNDSSIDGSTDGFGDGSDGGTSSDGGGDSGGGCGGGCGGGGD